MRQLGRYGRGDYVPGAAAEINRARRRLNIIEAAEKRLVGAELQAKAGDPKEATPAQATKPKRFGRLRGFYRQ